jgi:hypothetical protein
MQTQASIRDTTGTGTIANRLKRTLDIGNLSFGRITSANGEGKENGSPTSIDEGLRWRRRASRVTLVLI